MTRGAGRALLILWLAGCGESGAPLRGGRRFDPGPVPDSLFAGAALYREYCSSCHGGTGTGDGVGPPLLDSLYAAGRYPDDALLRAVREGAPQRHWSFGDMPVIHRASPGDVARITAYLRWLQARAVELEG